MPYFTSLCALLPALSPRTASTHSWGCHAPCYLIPCYPILSNHIPSRRSFNLKYSSFLFYYECTGLFVMHHINRFAEHYLPISSSNPFILITPPHYLYLSFRQFHAKGWPSESLLAHERSLKRNKPDIAQSVSVADNSATPIPTSSSSTTPSSAPSILTSTADYSRYSVALSRKYEQPKSSEESFSWAVRQILKGNSCCFAYPSTYILNNRYGHYPWYHVSLL